MRVTWNDLNNVQEVGDFPFRDGVITVTFAEIAVWKANPRAAFQLMRKNPIIQTPKYVLGEQKAAEPASEKVFYKSSNGDCWSLVRDPTTDGLVITHTANSSSGGNVSQIDVETFLTNDALGPEHQALRRLLEKTSNATILIAYDVHPSEGAAYDDLTAAIQSLGAWWHHLETVWIVRSNHSLDEIRDKLKPHIGADDQLLIVNITANDAVWAGVSECGSTWLKENVHPDALAC
jgi:hypothetical protein